MVSKKNIHHSYEGRIEKFVSHDHQLSSLGKPRDGFFLSHPHTHDGYLYSRTPDRDFHCYYPCEIFLFHKPTHLR